MRRSGAAGGSWAETRAVMQWTGCKPYNMRIPSRPDAAVMSMRWFSFLFVTVFVCAGMVHAQDEPVSPVPDNAAEQQPIASDPAAPAGAEPPGISDLAPAQTGPESAPTDAAAPIEPESTVTDTAAAPIEPGSTVTGTAPAVVESSTGAPAVVPASGPVSTAGNDDRLRSIFILVSAVVLITTLIAIIIILLKRGREARQEQRRYVAEAFLRDVSGSTTLGMYKLGLKPIMLGRVGGKDTEFLDYIVIPSATIGRRHALIEFKDFGYWVMDQGSINGTFVNDRPVSAEVRLKHGDRLRLHKLEFEFVMPELGESGVTVLAQDGSRPAGAAAAPASAPVQSDFVLEPEADPGPDAGGDDLDGLRESVESAEATLLPGSSATAAPAGGSDDETLLPGSSATAAPAGGSDDETLLPASGGAVAAEETLLPASGSAERGKDKSSRPGNGKKEDDVFDITGGG